MTWAFKLKRWKNQARMGLRTQTGLGTALLLLQCYVYFQGTPVILLYHRKRWENQAGMGLQTQTGLDTALFLLVQCYVPFMVLQLYCCTTGNDRKIKQRQAYKHKQGWVRLSCCCNFTFLFMALKLYCCTTGNDGKTKQEWVYEQNQEGTGLLTQAQNSP